jgi:hypothetical protein
MGSSNPVKKIAGKVYGGAKDLVTSAIDDPLGALSTAGAFGGTTQSVGATYQTGTRAREDMQDQAAGMAQKEQVRAGEAEARAIDASVKDLDAVTLERRRRAALAAGKGRDSTILTGGTSLGSADVARKTLLGM